jgi:hypothetical protein
MRNLKYLQLFEAFESQRLSKTLKFINQGARENFMESLNRISKRFDFPISKFNDDMFEYLPFKSALKKNVAPPKEPEKEVCNRESDWIPGEFCQGGRVKRTWGAHTRMTECPGCGGTGFKPLKKATPEVSIVKFWFDKDGNWVTVTGCDGLIRSQNTKYGRSDLYHFSKDVNDYNKLRQIDFNELLGLSTGTIVNFREPGSGEEEYAVSMVLNEGKVFLLQNLFPGSSPGEYGLDYDWKAYADCSWIVTSRADFGSAFLLEPKDKKVDNVKKEIKEFPQEVAYEWNNFIDLRYMQMSSHRDMEERLKNAHFAIILDINKLKESEFQKLSLTKSERELRKVGAFINPENVKSANIKRYFDILIKRFDANKGLSELTKVIPRAFGYGNILTFILRGFNIRTFDELIDNLYYFMQNPNDVRQRQIISSLDSLYISSRDKCSNINRTIDEVWKLLDRGRGDKVLDEKAKKYFETYEEISDILFKKVSSEKIETLTDIETLLSKFRSLKQFVENTRLGSVRYQVRYIADYLVSGYANQVFNCLHETLDEYPNAQVEIEELKKVIEKTF